MLIRQHKMASQKYPIDIEYQTNRATLLIVFSCGGAAHIPRMMAEIVGR